MKTVRLGKSGLKVSQLGLGCMGMSEFYGPTDDVESRETLARAEQIGVNFLDTADMYGQGDNEKLIGEFLRKRKHEFRIATKFGIVRSKTASSRSVENSPQYIERACHASLQRLGVETIDLYYAHRINIDQPIEETVAAMAKLVEQGKVRAIGLCEVSAEMLRRAHSVFPISAVQSEYSLWTRNVEQTLLPACRELDVSLVAYCPLGRGFLTGAMTAPDQLPANDFRRSVPRFSKQNLQQNLRTLTPVFEIAKSKNISAAQVALSWLLAKGSDIIPIPGTRKIHHLQDNFRASEVILSDQEIALLDNAMPLGIAHGERYSPEGMGNIYT